jgi:hypothetical protein
MLTEDQVRGCLAQEWGLPEARLTRLDGGLGSRTWIVDDAGRRWVLKAVAPGLGMNLAGGLVVARRLESPRPSRPWHARDSAPGRRACCMLIRHPGRSGSTP